MFSVRKEINVAISLASPPNGRPRSPAMYDVTLDQTVERLSREPNLGLKVTGLRSLMEGLLSQIEEDRIS